MRREDRCNADLPQQRQRILRGVSGLAQAAQRTLQAATLRRECRVEAAGKPAALAMVSLRQIDQLKVEAEGARQLIGRFNIECVNDQQRLLQCAVGYGGVAAPDGPAQPPGGWFALLRNRFPSSYRFA